MIWVLIIGMVLSMVIDESAALETLDVIKKEIKIVVEDKNTEKEAMAILKEMRAALKDSEKIKKKGFRNFYNNLEEESGLEPLQTEFELLYKDLEVERIRFLESRESLVNTLSDSEWDQLFSE